MFFYRAMLKCQEVGMENAIEWSKKHRRTWKWFVLLIDDYTDS